ncbi:MAG: PilZ domain-containing protein [Alphaproteobacteria bacterium]|nr:PilZ domain-containing protein [Alphaproteobacteria bacterium]
MDKQDYPCIMDTITETQMTFLTVGPAVTNYSFICYMDVVGRLPGTICGRVEGGFVASINLTENRMGRVIERLEWYQTHRQAQQQSGEARAHDRQNSHVQAELRLMNGATYPCEILDVSFSGMAIRSGIVISIGSPISVGNLSGVVVRAEGHNIGIKFNDMLSKTSLDTLVT